MTRKSIKRFALLAGILALAGTLGLFGFLLFKSWLFPPRNPVLIDIAASYPGASAEEVERQVTIPLEITFAGMPRLRTIRSKSVFGSSYIQVEFEDRVQSAAARQEVINRLATISKLLPPGVIPGISPAASRPETFRYVLASPKDPQGRGLYTLNDLRALQDWALEREFRRVPRVMGVDSFGGTVRRYEVQPDPERLRRYGVTLANLQNAVNPGIAMTVRSIGLFGGGVDPVVKAVSLKDPAKAASHLRAEETRRIREIRQLVIATVKGQPVRVEDVVDGGPLAPGEFPGATGVVVAIHPRRGQVGIFKADKERPSGSPLTLAEVGHDEDDGVEGVIHLRPGEDARIAWSAVRAKIEQLNDPNSGRMLPGVQIEPYLEGAGPPEHFWVHATLPADASPAKAADLLRQARKLLSAFPEVEKVVSELGRPDDGATAAADQTARLWVGLRPQKDWPNTSDSNRPRTKAEVMDTVNEELERTLAGVAWDCSVHPREGLRTAFEGGDGEPVLKLLGPDLNVLLELARQVIPRLEKAAGVRSVHVLPFNVLTHLEFRVDIEKCSRWGITAAEVSAVLKSALDGQAMGNLIEGEKTFDITVRWPERLRRNEQAILDIPVNAPADQPLRLRDLVSPIGADGFPAPKGAFIRPTAAAIYRENGKPLILLQFLLRGRDLTTIRTEVQNELVPLLLPGYRLEWGHGR